MKLTTVCEEYLSVIDEHGVEVLHMEYDAYVEEIINKIENFIDYINENK